MSYDIRIMKGNDPYGDPTGPLDAGRAIDAVNSFSPFVELGITWDNERWNEHKSWEGLVIHFEEWEAADCAAQMSADRRGTADACNMHISYGTLSDLEQCIELALHIAEATSAVAWDLQEDRPIEAGRYGVKVTRFERMRKLLVSLLGGQAT